MHRRAPSRGAAFVNGWHSGYVVFTAFAHHAFTLQALSSIRLPAAMKPRWAPCDGPPRLAGRGVGVAASCCWRGDNEGTPVQIRDGPAAVTAPADVESECHCRSLR